MLVALLSFITLAQASTPAQAPAAATDSTIDFTTANGLKTIHRRVQGNDVVAVRLYFKGGVRNITAKNAGIESLMLEVAQQGTKTFSKSQINRELSRTGTVIESAGGYDYSIIALRCVRQQFDRAWQLFTDMVLNPLFDEKEVALARDQMISALRQENDDPDSTVASASERLLYAAHPYLNSPTGSIETISTLTAADLKAYHTAHLMTSRLLLVTVGNITPEEIKRKVEASFGKLPQGDYKAEPLPSFSNAGKPEFQVTERSVQTNYVRGTFAAPPLNHPDYPALSVAINILEQFFFQEVRVQRNLSYGAEATLLAQGANSGSIYVTTQKPNETLQVMFDQIEFLQRQMLAREGLRSIVSGFLTNYYDKLQTNNALAARLGEYELLGGGWRRSLNWIDEVSKVTPEDIQRVSRTYLKNFHFAVMGEANKFDRALFTSR